MICKNSIVTSSSKLFYKMFFIAISIEILEYNYIYPLCIEIAQHSGNIKIALCLKEILQKKKYNLILLKIASIVISNFLSTNTYSFIYTPYDVEILFSNLLLEKYEKDKEMSCIIDVFTKLSHLKQNIIYPYLFNQLKHDCNKKHIFLLLKKIDYTDISTFTHSIFIK